MGYLVIIRRQLLWTCFFGWYKFPVLRDIRETCYYEEMVLVSCPCCECSGRDYIVHSKTL